MSLTFGTQGRSWRLESCLEEMEGEKGSHAQEPQRVLLSFNRSRYWLQVWLLTNSDDEMESTAWYQIFELWVGILGWNCTTLKSNMELSLVAQTVKRLPTMRETWVQSLGREDLLEKEMAAHSSILAWKIPWMEESGRLQSMGSQRVGHDWVTSLTQ